MDTINFLTFLDEEGIFLSEQVRATDANPSVMPEPDALQLRRHDIYRRAQDRRIILLHKSGQGRFEL